MSAIMTTDDARHAELSALAPVRERLYTLLSSAFREPPSAELVETLRSKDFLSDACELFSGKTLAPLREYAAAAGETAELQRQARQEYMNLFKIPGGQYVTPYESVYRDTRDVAGQKVTGLLMGQSAVDVQKWYKLAATQISEEYRDLPDHICLELNFVAHLCSKEQQFASDGDDVKLTRAWEMQRDFLAGHVVPWIGQLRDKIYQKSQHAYFRAVADMTVELVERDLTTLEGILGESKGNSAPQYT